MLTAQPPIIRYLTLQARKADRRSQKLLSNFSFIAALLEESKAELLHGHQALEWRPALPVGVLLIFGLQKSFRVAPEDSHGHFARIAHEIQPPLRLSTWSNTKAFTESKASAAFVKRRDPKCSSSCFKKLSRSASPANSTATPRVLSGEIVGIARNSLTLNPRSPGNVVQPN